MNLLGFVDGDLLGFPEAVAACPDRIRVEPLGAGRLRGMDLDLFREAEKPARVQVPTDHGGEAVLGVGEQDVDARVGEGCADVARGGAANSQLAPPALVVA